jgi:hypothetical protein
MELRRNVMTKIAWLSALLFVLSGALLNLPIDFARRPPHIAQRMTRSEITKRAEASVSPARRPAAESYGRLPNGPLTSSGAAF